MPASGSDQYEVEELRRRRMQAILASHKHAIAAADAGYGLLRDVSSTQAQELVAEAPAAVVHLWEPGFAAELDELLSRAAFRYPGTRFVRTPVRHCGEWLHRLRQAPRQPLLLAAQYGGVAGVVPVAELARRAEGRGGGGDDESSDFGDSDVEAGMESAAEGWLRCCGVLHSKAPRVAGAAGGPGDTTDDEEACDGDEWQTPCKECGRTYPHEHKRAVRKGGCDSDGDEG